MKPGWGEVHWNEGVGGPRGACRPAGGAAGAGFLRPSCTPGTLGPVDPKSALSWIDKLRRAFVVMFVVGVAWTALVMTHTEWLAPLDPVEDGWLRGIAVFGGPYLLSIGLVGSLLMDIKKSFDFIQRWVLPGFAIAFGIGEIYLWRRLGDEGSLAWAIAAFAGAFILIRWGRDG
jgi:hypothetical protein